jgi:hypothetical protein
LLKYVKAKFDGEPPVHAICHATVAHAKKTIKEMRLKGCCITAFHGTMNGVWIGNSWEK